MTAVASFMGSALPKRRGVQTLLRMSIVLLAAGLSAGCAMTESTLIDIGAKKPCDSDAGAYHLSKTMFEVIVTDVGGKSYHTKVGAKPATKPVGNNNASTDAPSLPDEELLYSDASKRLISVQARVVADRTRGYCIDFLASPTAEEAIFVGRDNGLLQKITTDSKDRSAEILKNLIKTVLIAGASDDDGPGLRGDPEAPLVPKQLFKGSYDPLNSEQANLINNTLRPLGFCLVVDEQEFNHHVHGIQDYCNNPLGHHSREKALDKSAAFDSHAAQVQHVRGVFYRPRVAYNYYLYIKRGNSWKLRKSVTVNLENKSPVLALQIDRAFFTTRKTTLTFDQGSLMHVRVEKGSELAGFVEVPLTLAQGIAALPANVVKVKIDVTNQRSTLIAAQDSLVAAQLLYTNDLRASRGLQPLGAAGMMRSDPASGWSTGQPQVIPPAPKDGVQPGGNVPPPPFKQSEGVGPGTRSDPGGFPVAKGGQRSGAFRAAATPASGMPPAAQCQIPCVGQGSSGPACHRYCACYGQCVSAAGSGTSEDLQRTCGGYCVGFLD